MYRRCAESHRFVGCRGCCRRTILHLDTRAKPAVKHNRIAPAALIHVLNACIMHRTEEWSPYSTTAPHSQNRLHVDLHVTRRGYAYTRAQNFVLIQHVFTDIEFRKLSHFAQSAPKMRMRNAKNTHSVRVGLWVTHRTDPDQITSYPGFLSPRKEIGGAVQDDGQDDVPTKFSTKKP